MLGLKLKQKQNQPSSKPIFSCNTICCAEFICNVNIKLIFIFNPNFNIYSAKNISYVKFNGVAVIPVLAIE